MQLTRRDAAAALAAIGVTGGTAVGVREWQRTSGDDSSDDHSGGDDGSDEHASGDLADDRQVRDVAVAVAEVVYPSELTGVAEFVEGVLAGRLDQGGDHARELRRTAAELDDLAVDWHDAPVAELDPSTRDRLLREVGADAADEDPDGTTAERVRYYVVNELLLALYSSPTGGELVGIENPQGHPGGLDSYQRGPDA